ncbi:LA_2272 family surface repeat-containing protein [Archangium sp.]|jgi:hypothetical protein|uniref:LA_2272 family surface repeat-containing protein n=1 Tax=Archangium sp. TaxID=1872627 RepID=UPI002EDBA732
MKREVSVGAGLMAAMVAFSAGAQEPAPEQQAPVAQVSQQAPAVRKPLAISILPGLSTNGFASDDVVNNISLGVIASDADRVEGLALAFGGNWVSRELRGMELAMGANYAGQVRGLQLSLGGNVAGGSMRGWQTALGANIAAGEMVGAQLTTGVNIAAGHSRGLQAAMGLNIAPDMVGVQVSSGLNLARRFVGAQLSLLNVGGDVSGAQVGLVNVAKRMKGLQFGLLNVASEAETSIGLLNLVGNGQHHVQAWVSDLAMTNVALKIGSRNFHTLFTLGLRPTRHGEPRWWAAGLGLGAHLPFGPLFVDLDVLASSLHEGQLFSSSGNLLGQLRLVGGWQPFSHFALFGGVTANTLVTFHGEALTGADRFRQGQVFQGDGARVQVWPGFVAGVQL